MVRASPSIGARDVADRGTTLHHFGAPDRAIYTTLEDSNNIKYIQKIEILIAIYFPFYFFLRFPNYFDREEKEGGTRAANCAEMFY